jgi:hypothetical protein
MVLNNMRIQIEKQNDINESPNHDLNDINDIHDDITPKASKHSTCPNLKYVVIKKKKNSSNKFKSIVFQNKLTLESNISLGKVKTLKRSLTFDISEQRKKKTIQKNKNEII